MFTLHKNREITRENRKLAREAERREESLDRQNAYGANDPTPYAAVQHMIQTERKAEREAERKPERTAERPATISA